MEFEKRIDTTLNWLFERYLENPNNGWNIAECLGYSLQEVYELGKFLSSKGYVKNGEYLENGFSCSITVLGITRVSDILAQVKYKILEGSIESKKRSVMEILELDSGHFRRVHDYATYLKRLGIIECIFHHNDVFAEPTFYGREWYEQNKMKVVN